MMEWLWANPWTGLALYLGALLVVSLIAAILPLPPDRR